MSLKRIFAAACLAFLLFNSGCSLVKDDPLIGDNPWQPGTFTSPASRAGFAK